jgi:CO dehydrogenase/acetyl-CoA synthase delta subunit
MTSEKKSSCSCDQKAPEQGRIDLPMLNTECCGSSKPESEESKAAESCCSDNGPQEEPVSFREGDFITGEITLQTGKATRIRTDWSKADFWGTFAARCGLGRNTYAVRPGLYCVGTPDAASPVMVTGNYKLSFDHLRRDLEDISAWILVLDTKSINVWCAAGKGTFGTDELLKQIRETGLHEIVSHRKLILPQLGATGVAAHLIKKETGFRVIWGPVRSEDIKSFLEAGMKADKKMRQVRFAFHDRWVLVPVELKMLIKPTLILFGALLLLSGIGPGGYLPERFSTRGLNVVIAGIGGILTGAVLFPLLLPWIPFRSFYLKGILAALVLGIPMLRFLMGPLQFFENTSLILFMVAMSSYLSMNFTGSTPFTSPTGVEKEMKRGIPIQAMCALIAFSLWMVSPFV